MPRRKLSRAPRALSAALCVVALVGCERVDTFDDCVLKHMEGVTSDDAAQMIYESCREKFPEEKKVIGGERYLTPQELGKLTGRAGLSFGNRYSGSIYNGNESIVLSSVTIGVTGKLDEAKTAREYTAKIKVPPLTTRDFSVDIVVGDQGTEYSWSITRARGYVE